MKSCIRTVCLFLAVVAWNAPALAQQYPAKPVRLILPFPPGAPSDLVGRTIGQKLGEQMGQTSFPTTAQAPAGAWGSRWSRKRRPTVTPSW